MPGSFGGGGGSAGQINIGVFLDDTNFNSKVGGVNTKLGTLGTSAGTATSKITGLGTAAGTATSKVSGLGAPIQTVSTNAKGAVSNLNSVSSSVGKVGNAANTANPGMLQSSKNIGQIGLGAGRAVGGVSKFLGAFGSLTGIDVTPIQAAMNVVALIPGNLGKVSKGISAIGGGITKQFTGLANIITGVGNAASNVPGKLTPLSGALANIGKNGPGATGAMSGFKGALSGVAFGPIGIAIAAIGIALLAIKTNAFGITDKLNAIGKSIGDANPLLKPFLEFLKSIVSTLLGMDGALDVGVAWKAFVGSVTAAVNSIWKTFIDTIAGFSKTMTTLFNLVTPPWLKDFIAFVTPAAAAAAKAIAGGIKTIADNIAKIQIPKPVLDFIAWVQGGLKGLGEIGKTPDQPVQKIDPKTKKPIPVTPKTEVKTAPIITEAMVSQSNVNANRIRIGWNVLSTAISKINSAIAKSWALTLGAEVSYTGIGTTKIRTLFNTLATGISKINSAIAKSWGDTMNNEIKNAASAISNIIKRFNSMASSISKINSAIARSWGDTMGNMVTNAASAANKIQKSLNSIKAPSLTVNVGLSGAGAKFVGHAKGFHGMVTEPTLMLVGEKGPERVDVTPNNQITNRTDGSGGSFGSFNQTVNLHISGNDIVNERNLSKKIRFEIGKNMDKFG